MKKYLLISEVEEILGISQASIRYIEKTHPNIKISKIRGRRYYKFDDIDNIAAIAGVAFEGKSIDKMGSDAHEIIHKKTDQLDMFTVLEKIKKRSDHSPYKQADLAEQRQRLVEMKERLVKLLK